MSSSLLKPEAGLADLLRGRDVYDEALTAVPSLEHLRVLCAGAIPGEPAGAAESGVVYLCAEDDVG